MSALITILEQYSICDFIDYLELIILPKGVSSLDSWD